MKILLVGGGTGGHVLSLRNLVDCLVAKGAEVVLLVADQDLDRRIVDENFGDVSVLYLKTGKLRRYFSWENFSDAFLVLRSVFVARGLIKDFGPDVVFFKGGFVGFPVFVALRFLMFYKGRIFSHESDAVPGLVTRFVGRFADRVFCSFGEGALPLFYVAAKGSSPKDLNQHDRLGAGCNPAPASLPLNGAPTLAKKNLGVGRNPTPANILILGGSQGALFLNGLVERFPGLCEKYAVTLVSGVGKKVSFVHENFRQFEFLSAVDYSREIADSDLVISRAGATSLFEIVAAGKPSIVIPLPGAAQDHQRKNAAYFEGMGVCRVVEEEGVGEGFVAVVGEVLVDESVKRALGDVGVGSGAGGICEELTVNT